MPDPTKVATKVDDKVFSSADFCNSLQPELVPRRACWSFVMHFVGPLCRKWPKTARFDKVFDKGSRQSGVNRWFWDSLRLWTPQRGIPARVQRGRNALSGEPRRLFGARLCAEHQP